MSQILLDISIIIFGIVFFYVLMKPFEERLVLRRIHGDIQHWSSSARAGGYGMVFDDERGVGVKNAVSAEECQNRANKLMNADVKSIVRKRTLIKATLISYFITFPIIFILRIIY